MEEIVHTCKKHGRLTLEKVRVSHIEHHRIYYRCYQCDKDKVALNRDKIRKNHKIWRENNPDKIRVYSKISHEKNRERIKVYESEYRAKNKDTIRDKRKLRYQKNIDQKKEKSKIFRKLNKEKVLKTSREYDRKSSNTLSDSYVKKLVALYGSIPRSKVTKELLNLKRLLMRLQTEIRSELGTTHRTDLKRLSIISLPPEFLEARELEAKGNPEIELKYTQEIADLIEEEYEQLLLTISATPE